MTTYRMEDEHLLTLKEALAYLRISRSTLYRFLETGRITGRKVGNTWRFRQGELHTFVESGITQPEKRGAA